MPLGGGADNLPDLFFVQKEFAAAVRVFTDVPRLLIRLDIKIIEEDLFAIEAGKAVLEIDISRSDRFDLAAVKNDPALPFIRKKIITEGFFIGRDCPTHNGFNYSIKGMKTIAPGYGVRGRVT